MRRFLPILSVVFIAVRYFSRRLKDLSIGSLPSKRLLMAAPTSLLEKLKVSMPKE